MDVGGVSWEACKYSARAFLWYSCVSCACLGHPLSGRAQLQQLLVRGVPWLRTQCMVARLVEDDERGGGEREREREEEERAGNRSCCADTLARSAILHVNIF